MDGMGSRTVQSIYKGKVCTKRQTVIRDRCSIITEEEGTVRDGPAAFSEKANVARALHV